MALKCADICNPCRPWELSKQWSEKVTEEFFHQGARYDHDRDVVCLIHCSKLNLCISISGDVEKKHKLEVSPLCDREANTLASVQIGKIVTFLSTRSGFTSPAL